MLVRRCPALLVMALVLAGCGSPDKPVVAGASSTDPSTAATTSTSSLAAASTTLVPVTNPAPTTVVTKPSAATTTTSAQPGASGVRGTVTAGPACGAEEVGKPCPPIPVQATVEAVARGRVAGRGATDAAGAYAISLPPGRYTLRLAGNSIYPRCPETEATVAAGGPVTVDISCDTGIRSPP